MISEECITWTWEKKSAVFFWMNKIIKYHINSEKGNWFYLKWVQHISVFWHQINKDTCGRLHAHLESLPLKSTNWSKSGSKIEPLHKDKIGLWPAAKQELKDFCLNKMQKSLFKHQPTELNCKDQKSVIT